MKKIDLAIIVLGILVLFSVINVQAKESLTLEEVKKLEQSNTLTGYDLVINTAKDNTYSFHVDFNCKVACITPPFTNFKNLKVESSGIEDGMIYTLCSGETNSTNDKCQVLYINEPDTLEFVATSVMLEDLNLLYTYYDSNGMTVYDRHKKTPN